MKSNSKSERGRSGSSFDSFLDEEGILDEVEAVAVRRVIARQLSEELRNHPESLEVSRSKESCEA